MRQGRNPHGRVHYAGAIGCGRVLRCRLRLCAWVNRVVRRFRGVCGARGRKCERCATAGGLDWIPGCSWAANTAFKVDFAASRPGFGSNPGRVGATLGFLSITRSFTKRVALEGSRPSGEICFGVLLRASKRGQQTCQANEGRRANRGRRCVHDSALRSRRVSVNTPPSPVRRLRQPTAGNLQLCEADHAQVVDLFRKVMA